MKDLFKGHHPWLLVLVIAVDIFSALTIRHSILSKGESEFNANVFFFVVIVAGLALYALLVEFLSGKDMPLIGDKEEKQNKIIPQVSAISESESQSPEIKEPLSRRDIEDMMLNVISKLRHETAIPPEASLKKDENGVVSFNINDMKESAASLVKSQEDAIYRFACEYSAEKLGMYVKPRDLETLFFRLGLFQKASTPNWGTRSCEDIEAGIETKRIEVASPVEKWALLHYGWNMGRLFGKPNNFITHFLKTTFHYHLDGLSDNQLPKKLKQNPRQGVITIEERFDKGFMPNWNEISATIDDESEDTAVKPAIEIKESQKVINHSEAYNNMEVDSSEGAYDDDEIEYLSDDAFVEEDDDEPMNDEEWDKFVNRAMDRGDNSKTSTETFF